MYWGDIIRFAILISNFIGLFGEWFSDIFVIFILAIAIFTYFHINLKESRQIRLGLKAFNKNIKLHNFEGQKAGQILSKIMAEEMFKVQEEDKGKLDKLYDKLEFKKLFKKSKDKDLEESEMNKNSLLESIFNEYFSHYRKTGNLPEAEKFFTKNRVIMEPGKRQIAGLMPGILTSLGILGTFLGLQEGTSSLNNLAVEQMEETIQSMMEDMSLAFVTSIVGMITSIIWSIKDRGLFNKSINEYSRFIDNFNELIVKESSYNLLNQISDNSVEMVGSLNTLATDISLQFSESFSKTIDDKLLPGISESIGNSFGSSLNNIGDDLKEFTGEKITEQLSTLDETLDNFKDEIDDLSENQIKELRLTLIEFNDSKSDILDDFEDIGRNISETSKNLKNINELNIELMNKHGDTISELSNLNESLLEQNQFVDSILKDINEITNMNMEIIDDVKAINMSFLDLNSDINESFDKFGINMKNMNENLYNSSNDLANTLEENRRELGEILESHKYEFAGNLEGKLNKTFNIFDDNLSQIYGKLNSTMSEMNNVIRELPMVVSDMQSEMNRHVKNVSELLDENEIFINEYKNSNES